MHKSILKSWVNYIDLESLEKSKFDLGQINTKQFCELRVSEDNTDSVILDFSDRYELLDVLKKNYPIHRNSQEVDPNRLFLFFPIIQSIEIQDSDKNDKEFLHPLFAIEVTAQKQTLYVDGKLILNPYKQAGYIPLVAAMNKLIGVPSESFRENIPLNLLLNRITGSKDQTFAQSLSSLKKYIAGHLIIGKLFEYEAVFAEQLPSDYTKMLRTELVHLQNVDLSKAPLATRYLDHIGDQNGQVAPTADDLWQGAFDPRNPLTRGQATVLRKLERGDDLIAVQGGPGTGKTALFLSIIASRLVHRAVQLASTGEDMNTLMIIVSTANKAVDGVVEKLLKDEQFKDLNHFYFIYGNKKKKDSSLLRVNKLIEELKIAQYDQDKYEAVRQELLKAAEELRNPFVQYQRFQKDYERLLSEGSQRFGNGTPETWEERLSVKAEALTEKVGALGYTNKTPTMETLKGWLSERQTEVQEYHNRLWQLQQQYPKANLEAFDPQSPNAKEILTSIETVADHINRIPRWQVEFLFKKRTGIFNQWRDRFSHALKMIDNTIGRLTHRDVAQLLPYFDSLYRDASLLAHLKPSNALLSADLKNLTSEAECLAQDLEKVGNTLHRLREIKKQLASFETPDFAAYYRLQTVAQQRHIYELSLKFLWLEMVRRKKEMIDVLKDWLDIVPKQLDYNVARKWEKRGIGKQFALLSLAYPVLTSTLTSSNILFNAFFNEHIKNKNLINRVEKEKPIHLVLADESGMCPLHTIFPLLYKSEKAIIIGDPKQIEPIIPVGDVQAHEYEDENFSSIDHAYAYSPISVSAYHRAAGCKTGHFDDIGAGIVLDEHRRCQPDIADLFIDLANYTDLTVKTEELSQNDREKLERFGGRNLVFYNVDGAKGQLRNTNTDEVEAINRVLEKLEAAGYDLAQEVGIITPYTGQERRLLDEFQERLGHNQDNAKIGTLHKFQGVEFNVIIFSPVIFAPQDSTRFLNAKPNMLNVAVSRARHLFITCGNFSKLSGSGGYLQMLCEHSREYGYLLEGTPDDQIAKHHGIEYLDTCEHIAHLKQTLQAAEKEVIIITPWLRYDHSLSEQLHHIKEAVKRGIEIRIYYGWKQGDERETKDQIHHYREVIGRNLIRVFGNTHEKCLVCDRKEMAIGSFNWLSHPYTTACKEQQANWRKITIRRESSVVVRDRKVIGQVLRGLC